MEGLDSEIVVLKKNDELHFEIQRLIGLDLTKSDVSQIESLINQFEPCPSLLDKKLPIYINSLSQSYLNSEDKASKNRLAHLIYVISKIRGFKQVANHLSNDIYLIEKMIELISEDKETGDSYNSFFLLLWLSNLALVPFPLVTIDQTLPDQIYTLSMKFLTKNNGKEQVVSSLLLSRFLVRIDIINLEYLEKYLNYCGDNWSSFSNIEKLGHLSTIKNILKRCPSDTLKKYLNLIHEKIISCELLLPSSNSSTSKILIVKILSKLGLNYISSGNFDDFELVFNNFVDFLNDNETSLRYCLSKNLSKLCIQLPPDYRLEIINFLLKELDISNLCLPETEDEQADITDLDINYETLSIPHYHTILLVLAELCRSRLIPLNYLAIVTSIVSKTLFFIQHKITYSIGSQIRDSSCFICWSIFKKYGKEEIPLKILNCLLIKLILVSCFDKDLIIRRASSATLQELIGRFGSTIFESMPNKDKVGELLIKFIENFDFVKLGQLFKSFEICLSLVDLGFDRNIFISFLIKQGINNFDYNIRESSSLVLPKLLRLSQHIILKDDISPTVHYTEDSIVRDIITILNHAKSSDNIDGYLYTIAELLPQTEEKFHPLLSPILESVKFDYHKDQFYKGEEFLHLLTGMLIVDEDFEVSPKMWDSVLNIIRPTNDKVISKFQRFISVLNADNFPLQKFDKLVYYIKNNNLTAAKSIGYYRYLSMFQFLQLTKLVEDKKIDAFCRSNLINSIDHFLQHEQSGGHQNGILQDTEIIANLINQLDDYTLTNQGDVGNKIRSATIQLIDHNLQKISTYQNLVDLIELKLIRIMGEVIDRLRVDSLSLLFKLKGMAYDNYIEKSLLLSNNSDKDSFLKFYFSNLDSYYHFILKYYELEILVPLSQPDSSEHFRLLSKEFLRGFVFSAGAITATNSTISSSLKKFLVMWEKSINEVQRLIILIDLLALLKIDPEQNKKSTSKSSKVERLSKVQICSLHLFVRIFESGISIPEEFNFDGLYVRSYNLHLNTTNVTKVGLVLKIFSYLVIRLNKKDALKRICWVCCNHPISRIRELASESLFEIYNERLVLNNSPESVSVNLSKAISYIQNTNWNDDVKSLKHLTKNINVEF